MNEVSLHMLVRFTPENEIESNIMNEVDWEKVVTELMNYTTKSWSNGCYWLGGQIKMTPEELISLEKIQEARNIGNRRLIELGGPTNSFEAASIEKTRMDLNRIEMVIKNYIEIMKSRIE